MSKNKYSLSIIIPFLNEGPEVESTINSIITNSDNKNFEIILINDASNDYYDYDILEKKYNIVYLKNKKRLGVAASRDFGVEICHSDYFLLLDAHMRFYDSTWFNKIVETLKMNDRRILCCQTKELILENNIVIERSSSISSFGACVSLLEDESILEPKWVYSESDNGIIPCILGAGYAASKQYWKYIKGLTGLKYYGNDETYLSIKTFLAGGECVLLKDVIIGHIYRDTAPYKTETMFRVYNKLLIAELLLPFSLKKRIFGALKQTGSLFREALFLLYKNRKEVFSLQEYFKNILIKPFSYYENINSPYFSKSTEQFNNLKIEEIKEFVVSNADSLKNIGLFYGKMGVVLFLYHYAQSLHNKDVYDYADNLVDEICECINIETPVGLANGLCGIGWGIIYLLQNEFLEEDTDLLEEIDEKIMEYDPQRIRDLSVETGLGGILHYILFRFMLSKKKSIKINFDTAYLLSVANRVYSVISQPNITEIEDMDVFIKYAVFMQKRHIYNYHIDIYDILYLKTPNKYNIKNNSIGLKDGWAGLGLSILLKTFST